MTYRVECSKCGAITEDVDVATTEWVPVVADGDDMLCPDCYEIPGWTWEPDTQAVRDRCGILVDPHYGEFRGVWTNADGLFVERWDNWLKPNGEREDVAYCCVEREENWQPLVYADWVCEWCERVAEEWGIV